jgi:hypothetical protein
MKKNTMRALALIGLGMLGLGETAWAQCASGYFWDIYSQRCVFDAIAESHRAATAAATRNRQALQRRESIAWGAIAIDANHTVTGASVQKGSKQAAEADALEDCGRADCTIVTSFEEQCASVALASDRQIGIGRADSAEDAARRAMAECNAKSSKMCFLPDLPSCTGFNRPATPNYIPVTRMAEAWKLAARVDTRQYWGAQASNSKVFKSAIDHKDQTSAEQAVLAACGAADCKVLAAFENSCGATATYKIPDGHVIVATATDRHPYTVQGKALKECSKTGKPCGIAELSCTGREYREPKAKAGK